MKSCDRGFVTDVLHYALHQNIYPKECYLSTLHNNVVHTQNIGENLSVSTLTSNHHRAGGGKGVVQQPRGEPGQGIDPELRTRMFYDYGDLLSSLNGCYGMLHSHKQIIPLSLTILFVTPNK